MPLAAAEAPGGNRSMRHGSQVDKQTQPTNKRTSSSKLPPPSLSRDFEPTLPKKFRRF